MVSLLLIMTHSCCQKKNNDSLLAEVVGYTPSGQMWNEIHNYFHPQTPPRDRKFCFELRNTQKSGRSISKYLLTIKALIDSLISRGLPVSTQEHLEVILDGLPVD